MPALASTRSIRGARVADRIARLFRQNCAGHHHLAALIPLVSRAGALRAVLLVGRSSRFAPPASLGAIRAAMSRCSNILHFGFVAVSYQKHGERTRMPSLMGYRRRGRLSTRECGVRPKI